jgi:hypothetical protein
MGHKYMDTDAKVRGTMKEQPHPRGKGTLGDIERRAGCQRRVSDGHEKQAMCLNQGGGGGPLLLLLSLQRKKARKNHTEVPCTLDIPYVIFF